jgi:AcrR family transcriptional regulator
MAKRRYTSEVRQRAAADTRRAVLDAARTLFSRHGIDRVTIARIAAAAGVSAPTVYALYKSKEGILRALVDAALFGPAFQAAAARLTTVRDPVELIALTAQVARAVYESESASLGLLRGASAFSHALRKAEQALEQQRFEMQGPRVELLFAQSKARPGLTLEKARHLLWMYTSRDVYRMLVQEQGWSPDEYEQWLADTLVRSLVTPDAAPIVRRASTPSVHHSREPPAPSPNQRESTPPADASTPRSRGRAPRDSPRSPET